MNKLARFVILISFLFLGLLIAAPFFLDTKPLKFQIEQQISNKLNANFEIKGEVDISFVPFPKISINDAIANNIAINQKYFSNISVKNLTIKPSFFSLFTKNTKINNLVFTEAKIENKYNLQTNQDQKEEKPQINQNISGGFLNRIFNFKSSSYQAFDFKNIKKIEFKNSEFIKKGINQNILLIFDKINFLLKNNIRKQIFTVEGNFYSDSTPTSFYLFADAKNDEDSSLTIQSPILNLVINGKFSNSDFRNLTKSNFTGEVNAEIIDLKALINKYFSKNGLLAKKISPNVRPIKVSANIDNKNGKLAAKDILINSPIIDGNGAIITDFNNAKPDINLIFNFNNIDINNIWFFGALNNDPNIVDYENKIIEKFINKNQQITISENSDKTILIKSNNVSDKNKPIFTDINLQGKIKIKSATYQNGNLQNIDLQFNTNSHQEIEIKPLTAKLPGSSKLTLNGVLNSESDIAKFNAKIEISGENFEEILNWLNIKPDNLKNGELAKYYLSTDLLSLPSFNVFNNFNLSINNGKNIIVGNIKIDDSKSISTSNANLRINNFNYDEYFNDDKASEYLSPGSLLKKLLWLNTVSHNRNIYLLFDNLIYQNQNFNNQALRISFGAGYFKFLDLDLKSDDLDLKGNVQIAIAQNQPNILINLTANNFKYQNPQKDFVKQFFDLPSLADFDGRINIDIGNFALNGWPANNIKIVGNIENGVINFENFILGAYEGVFKYNGSIIVKNNKTVNGTIEIIEGRNDQILNDLLAIKNINGISNISAVINSKASSKKQFFKNLNLTAKFVSGNIGVDGFGIYPLAAKMLQPNFYQKDLRDPLNILYGSNAASVFKEASGNVEFSKNKGGKFHLKTSALGINGIVSGDIDYDKNINGSGNFIFISGNRKSQIPINLAVNFKGQSGRIQQNTNLTQIEQYLGKIK